MLRKILLAVLLSVLTIYCLPQSMNWMADGNSYTIIESGKMVKVELPSMNKTTLVEADQFIPKGSTQAIQLSGFKWSDDYKKLLLNVKTTTLYHKTTGEVWVYNTGNKKLVQLGTGLRQNGLMYACLLYTSD